MDASKNTILEELHHDGNEPHLLREVFRTYHGLVEGFARRMGMPASRFALMRQMAFADGDLGVTDLARMLGVNPAAVTRQLQEMEKDGLVRRRNDPADARRCRVSLSPKGRRAFAAAHDRSHEIERSLASALGAERMKDAAETLRMLRDLLDGATKPTTDGM